MQLHDLAGTRNDANLTTEEMIERLTFGAIPPFHFSPNSHLSVNVDEDWDNIGDKSCSEVCSLDSQSLERFLSSPMVASPKLRVSHEQSGSYVSASAYSDSLDG